MFPLGDYFSRAMCCHFGMDARQVPFGASTDFVRPSLDTGPEATDPLRLPFRVMSLTASPSPAGTPKSIL